MKASLDLATSQVPDSISDCEFAEIVRITLEVSGIAIDDSKRPMIYSRFSRRLRELNLNSFSEYLGLLKQSQSEEYTAFINTVTTNLTYFFREPHHFEFLRETAIPMLLQRNAQNKNLRIWSSACSSGQEAYSIAMVLEEDPSLSDWSKRILATDIDTDMVKRTKFGCYATDSLRGLSLEQQSKWMHQTTEGDWLINDSLRQMLMTKQLNLFNSWPFRSGVDVIFCRNALIYFDEKHQLELLNKFSDFQSPGAFLFLGHSESIKSTALPYKRVSNTVYQRT